MSAYDVLMGIGPDDEDPIDKDEKQIERKKRRSHTRCIGDNLCADCDGSRDLIPTDSDDGI